VANKHRGEVEIILGGKSYTMRPTFEALVEFEDKAGTTAYEVMSALASRQAVGFKVMAAAVWSGIRAGWNEPGRAPSFIEVGEAIRKDGIAAVLPAFGQYLSNALTSESDMRRSETQDAGKAETAKMESPSP
jgi:hypothetical protein